MCWEVFTFTQIGDTFHIFVHVACRKINLRVNRSSENSSFDLCCSLKIPLATSHWNGMSKRGLKSNFLWRIPLLGNWYERLTCSDCSGAPVPVITNALLFQFRHWTSKPNSVALFLKALFTLKLPLSIKEYKWLISNYSLSKEPKWQITWVSQWELACIPW